MRPSLFATALLTSFALWAPAVLAATGLTIGPSPTSDRRFPYVLEGPAFTGTPLAVKAARLPGFTIVLGTDAGGPATDSAAAAQAASLAQQIGLWAEAPAAGSLVRLASDMTDADLAAGHLIVMGPRNPLFERLGKRLPADLGKQGPALWVVEDAFAPGKHVMVVTGRHGADVSQAVEYLANERLFFKSGAYDGFLAFVRLRTYLEKDNFVAATDLLDDPRQLRACAQPVMVMGPKLKAMPAEVGQLAQKRNQLVFGGIREALAKGDKPLAVARWQGAMETCYACHQGRGGLQVRKAAPPEYPHRQHQAIAERAGMSCTDCHQGVTASVGYR